MNIAIVGCGYVADMYMETLKGFENLTLVGAFDRDADRLAAWTRFHNQRPYSSFDALLSDDRVQLVLNLTNPRSHYEVSMRALQGGRHVYSEKPLGMTMGEAEALVGAARARGLGLAAAPCNHLSDVVQTLRRELAAGRLGRVVLAQAEMDDGMVPGLAPETWRSPSGANWPMRDEYEIGCTLEHAGYQISPLVSLFGAVRRVTAFNACLLPDKGREQGVAVLAPDFSVGVLEFDHGIVARLSNSIIAPADRSLRVIGERGVATIADVWEYHSSLRFSATGLAPRARLTRRIEKRLSGLAPRLMLGQALRVRHGRTVPRTHGGHRMDFCRGVARLAAQIEAGASTAPEAALALHVTEVSLALQNPVPDNARRTMGTSLNGNLAPISRSGLA